MCSFLKGNNLMEVIIRRKTGIRLKARSLPFWCTQNKGTRQRSTWFAYRIGLCLVHQSPVGLAPFPSRAPPNRQSHSGVTSPTLLASAQSSVLDWEEAVGHILFLLPSTQLLAPPWVSVGYRKRGKSPEQCSFQWELSTGGSTGNWTIMRTAYFLVLWIKCACPRKSSYIEPLAPSNGILRWSL